MRCHAKEEVDKCGNSFRTVGGPKILCLKQMAFVYFFYMFVICLLFSSASNWFFPWALLAYASCQGKENSFMGLTKSKSKEYGEV